MAFLGIDKLIEFLIDAVMIWIYTIDSVDIYLTILFMFMYRQIH